MRGDVLVPHGEPPNARRSLRPADVLTWVEQYSRVAVTALEGRKASSGLGWDLFAVLLQRPRIWWVVVDQHSGYILCSHLATGMARDGAREAVSRAKLSASQRAKGVNFHAVRPNRRWQLQNLLQEDVFKGIRNSLPRVALSMLCSSAELSYGGLRGQSFLRELEKTARKFNRVKRSETLATYLGGWVIHRNLFDVPGMPKASSPGDLARVEAPFTSWAGLVLFSASNARRP